MKYSRIMLAMVGAGLMQANVNAGEVNGILKDQRNKAVPNTIIKVRDNDIQTRTDADGRFTLDLPAGNYTLDVKGGVRDHFHRDISVSDEPQNITISMEVHMEDVIVVQANPLEHTKLDMAAPAVVISGETLTMNKAATLGEILEKEPGISMSSFGPAVSRPVIRGLAGGRVLITQNRMTVQDASVTSNDHDVALEPLLAEQIEVIKGPATLLYGSGATGGLINVTDSLINPYGADGIAGGVELRLGDSATSEESIVATLSGGDESFTFKIDAYSSETDNIEIPGFAESSQFRALEEMEEDHDHEDEHEDEHEEHDHEEEEEVFGVLENSFSETDGISAGATWIRDWGYFGASLSSSSKLYGVPGGHHHHEEEHEGEEHEEEHEGEEHDHEEEEENVSIDMEQTRIDFQAGLNNPFDGFDEWFIGLSNTDYEHVELEGDEIGTLFSNDATELRTYLRHEEASGWRGIIGLQWTDRDFSAIGDEAFVPPSETTSLALFVVEEKRIGDVKFELGIRYEDQSISVDDFSEGSYSATSVSAGAVIDIDEDSLFAINLSNSQRAPNVEELFSFGEHLATQTFEVGNLSLDTEQSLNLDLSYRFNGERFSGEINAFWNKYHDFIYGEIRENTGAVFNLMGMVEEIDDDLPLVVYTQQDADFRGFEFHIEYDLVGDATEAYDLSAGFSGDMLDTKLATGDNLPRIPASKGAFFIHYDDNTFTAELRFTRYAKQTDVGVNELPTNAFDLLDIEIGYRPMESSQDFMIFVKGKNLLDEEARDHASYIKDLAPRAGRSLVLGARYQF